jgi:diguanylate cyclase (GGDEF)-like protein
MGIPERHHVPPAVELVRTPSVPADRALDAEGLLASLTLIGVHVYGGIVAADGTYRDSLTGPLEARFLGREREPHELPTAAWDALVHPDDRARYDAHFLPENIIAGRPSEVEYRMLRPDGSERWIREHHIAHELPGGGYEIHGFVVDATDQRRLSDNHGRLGAIIETMHAHVFSDQVHPDGTRVEVFTGPNEELLLGGDPDPSLPPGDAWMAAVHPDDLAAVYAARYYELTRAALASGGSFEVEYRVVQPDGGVRWVRETLFPRTVDAHGVITSDGVIIDVSEHHRIQRELDAERARLALAVEHAGIHVYTDRRESDGTWRPLYSSPLLLQWLGASGTADETIELWHAAIHPSDRAGMARHEQRLARGEPSEIEHRVILPDGTEKWVWDRARPRIAEDGSIVADGVIMDVSARRSTTERLAQTQRRLEAAMQLVDEIFYEVALRTDGNDPSWWVSADPRRLLGYDVPTELVAPPATLIPDELLHPDDRGLGPVFRDRMLRGESGEVEVRAVAADGSLRRLRISGRPRATPGGTIIVAGTLADVTVQRSAERDLERARDEAERRSRIDALTGLFNRRHLSEAVRHELERASRTGTGTGVLMLDVDHFKQINDTYGHAAGDDTLVQMAARVGTAVRSYDTVARWGGEEIAVLLPDVADTDRLRSVAEAVRDSIAATPFRVQDASHRITVSVGAVLACGGGFSADAALDAADQAMYAAKRRGRDRVCLFDELTAGDVAAEEPATVRIAHALALSVSAREGMPAEHSEDVAQISELIAVELGLPQTVVVRCRMGGLLHDVGKMSVPDAILVKPGKLTDAEWRVIRGHPSAGEQAVRRIAGLADAAPAVRHHHERYDGSGYPDGLAADDIPVEARIVALADAYSTIVTARAYKPARPRDEAIAEILRCSGTHFDPDVVRAFATAIARLT